MLDVFSHIDISFKESLAAVVAIFGFWKYFDSRERELKWKRVEFLFSQAQYLDTDADIIKTVAVLANVDPHCKICDCFNEKGQMTAQDPSYIRGFEKLFNLLDRLAHARLTAKTLEDEEIKNFGWYLGKISESAKVSSYCEKNGYQDVVRLARLY